MNGNISSISINSRSSTPVYQNASASYTAQDNDPNKNIMIEPLAPIYIVEAAAGQSSYMTNSGKPK
jgi:hypothetical protein